MKYAVASDADDWIPPSMVSEEDSGQPEQVPAGTAHAYRTGESETLCGIAVATLNEFPNFDFEKPSPTLGQCATCTQMTAS